MPLQGRGGRSTQTKLSVLWASKRDAGSGAAASPWPASPRCLPAGCGRGLARAAGVGVRGRPPGPGLFGAPLWQRAGQGHRHCQVRRGLARGVLLLAALASVHWGAARQGCLLEQCVGMGSSPTRPARVPAQPCRRLHMCAARVHEGCGPVRGLTLSEFVAWWRQHQAARSAGDGGGSSSSGASGELLYVKDWHFTRDFPQYQVGRRYCPRGCAEYQGSTWQVGYCPVGAVLEARARRALFPIGCLCMQHPGRCWQRVQQQL